MFTGIVEEVGSIASIEQSGSSLVLTINASFAEKLELGESVAVNGICLTVVKKDKKTGKAAADMSKTPVIFSISGLSVSIESGSSATSIAGITIEDNSSSDKKKNVVIRSSVVPAPSAGGSVAITLKDTNPSDGYTYNLGTDIDTTTAATTTAGGWSAVSDSSNTYECTGDSTTNYWSDTVAIIAVFIIIFIVIFRIFTIFAICY